MEKVIKYYEQLLHNLDMCTQSIDLLALENLEEQAKFVMDKSNAPMYQCNFLICMKSISKNRDEQKSISLLLLCNENRELIIMEASGIKIKITIKLPSVGVFIETHGLYDIDGKIFVACRDGKVYVIKGGALTNQVYDIESKPVGIAYIEKSLIVAGMNNVISSYYGKGKKNYSIYMP
jgi:Bardet-Biedl syndrome 1 protein